ncbi:MULTISPECIES: type II secretion system protein [Burkholderia]|uniref:General secretion pathway protein G n=1 Tax=Burkholderia pyrrocinia TaxID=60550 RepID=A0A318IN47_BURPY|nr:MULTISPECIES: prepilin-type N-terminal cleavage/methylation domain-containing protein [Burkholderia]PXX25813.1 general secretion pathway protein G [Burkholderia pyrrocinia]SFW83609.1 general secretion pathway protein G [Burkholderia sp. NFACC33-1]SFY44819.1 general secretion pathway protein G [Burkholderia sp. NFPP32]
MAPTTKTGERRGDVGRIGAFTLIELLVVMAILATLLTIVAPRYIRQHDRARETVLRHNLAAMRLALDHYREDRGGGPGSLDELVSLRYIRAVPTDPITDRADTWKVEQDDSGKIGDVHSGAQNKALDGSKYADW